MAVVKGEKFPIIIRYSWIGADRAGEKRHPQQVVKELGFKVLKYEAVGIADCSMMLIDLEPETFAGPFPDYIERSDHEMV